MINNNYPSSYWNIHSNATKSKDCDTGIGSPLVRSPKFFISKKQDDMTAADQEIDRIMTSILDTSRKRKTTED